MTAGDRQTPDAPTPPASRCWIALPTALLANVLLFYVLAEARTTPAPPRAVETSPVRLTLMDLPSSPSVAPDFSQSEPDLISIATRETPVAVAEAVSQTSPLLTPRLPHGIEAIASDLPGLPVALPQPSNLRSTAEASSSDITGPLTASEVDRIPRRIAGVLPRYPRWARRAGLEGTVTLRFVVTREGTVANVNVHMVEGDERFGHEAARAVEDWRFDPALKQGVPVPYWFFQKINFALDD